MVTSTSLPMTVSNLPSTMWEEFGTRPTYSSESEIAAPGGGVAADADAPVVSCPCQGGEHQQRL